MTTVGMITPTIAIILVIIALIIFGPGKLPQLGKGLGRGIREFKTEANWDSDNNETLEKKTES